LDPKLKARLGGLLFFATGVGFTAYNWYTAFTQGTYMPKASFLFPVCASMGLSLMIYPITKAESLAKYGSEQMPLRHFPVGSKIIIVIGFLAGALNWALISGKL
jgi:hypothetical protein